MNNAIQDIKDNYVIIFLIATGIFVMHIFFFTYIPPVYYLKMFIPFLFLTFASRFIWILVKEVLQWKH
jgi:hypothetical protein